VIFKTLPGRYYTDPGVFRQETESFYFGKWICAGRAAAIPNTGDYFLREIAGESIVVVRDAMGAIRAHYNVCRHRGTRMCTLPQGNLERIQCPYHGWTYGLDGKLLGAPHMDCADFSREDYPLHTVQVALWDGHLFLHMGSAPEPLSRQLGGLPEKFAPWQMQDLRLYRSIEYEVKANWKLIVLNYNECLHCPFVHPLLNRLTDYAGADNEPPALTYVGGAMGLRDGAETMSMDGKRRRGCLPGLPEAEHRKVHYYAIYPNFLLSLHPDYMMLHTLWPDAVDRTRIICEWHFHPSELARPDFLADDAIEFWDTTNREDWRISELAQAGIQSRVYSPGPYSPREGLLHAFDEAVLEHERCALIRPHGIRPPAG
jgi:Rieske 2Fe-2S family protein